MSRTLFDTNVLLDIATADATWLGWSEGQFRSAAAQGPISINPIIYAELAPAFATQSDLDRWLDPALYERLTLPYAAGWLAAQAFVKYRRRRDEKFTVARLLHRCARRSRGADAYNPRRHALSDLLSKRLTHHSVTPNTHGIEDRRGGAWIVGKRAPDGAQGGDLKAPTARRGRPRPPGLRT